jgi:hypothetical protein
MKIILNERQYSILLKEDRKSFLRKQYVIDPELLEKFLKPAEDEEGRRMPGGINPKKVNIKPIENEEGVDIGYIVNKKGKQSVKLTDETFDNILAADPDPNNKYTQWMINVFIKHVNDNDIPGAVRFVDEDLHEANEFIEIFNKIKRTNIFKRSAPNLQNAPDNPTDINQYESLAQLYSVISPFLTAAEDEESGNVFWKKLKKYIDLGEAKLAYRDNNVLVYIPLTIESSCDPLGDKASWCTRREGNTYFDSYRRNNPKPNGDISEFYVVIPKNYFEGENEDDIYPLQFHFESNQLHDKNNRSLSDSKINSILNRFPGLRKFFLEELGALTAMEIKSGKGLLDSRYTRYLNDFGGSVKDYVDEDVYEEGRRNIENIARENVRPTSSLTSDKYMKWLIQQNPNIDLREYFPNSPEYERFELENVNITDIPDLSSYNDLSRVKVTGTNISEIPNPEKFPVEGFMGVVLQNNQITHLDLSGYEKLEDLFFLQLSNNPIRSVDFDSFEEVVRTFDERGGMISISIDGNQLSDEDKNRLKEIISKYNIRVKI